MKIRIIFITLSLFLLIIGSCSRQTAGLEARVSDIADIILDIDQRVQSLIDEVRDFIGRTDQRVVDLNKRVEELENRIRAIEEGAE